MTRALCLALTILAAAAALAAPRDIPTGGFKFTVETMVPGQPLDVYDAAFGDVSGWWDHTLSGDPHALYIEPKPGGAFMEIFDESGDGARHAVVTYAKRGEMLRFEGPLGLAGTAILMSTTWSFADADEGHTRITVEVHAVGEMDERTPVLVERTWSHFVNDRLTRYIEGGMRPLD